MSKMMRQFTTTFYPNSTAYEPFRHANSENSAPVQSYQPVTGMSKATRRAGFRRFSVVCSIISAAISLGIIGVWIDIIRILESSKTSRMLWSYGMMLYAWPLTGAPAIPSYVTLSAASATALLNIVLLLAVTFGDGVKSPGVANALGIATHVLLVAWFAAALVANGLYQPNLRSWACEVGSFETSYKSNIVGLGKVCTNTFANFISSIVAAAFELFNAGSIIIILLSERRMGRASPQYQRPAKYQKLDPSAMEADEVPMLALSRKTIHEEGL